jgi:hypothetical protein
VSVSVSEPELASVVLSVVVVSVVVTVVLIVADSLIVGAVVGVLAVASSPVVSPLPPGVPSSPHAARTNAIANERRAIANMSDNVVHGVSRG